MLRFGEGKALLLSLTLAFLRLLAFARDPLSFGLLPLHFGATLGRLLLCCALARLVITLFASKALLLLRFATLHSCLLALLLLALLGQALGPFTLLPGFCLLALLLLALLGLASLCGGEATFLRLLPLGLRPLFGRRALFGQLPGAIARQLLPLLNLVTPLRLLALSQRLRLLLAALLRSLTLPFRSPLRLLGTLAFDPGPAHFSIATLLRKTFAALLREIFDAPCIVLAARRRFRLFAPFNQPLHSLAIERITAVLHLRLPLLRLAVALGRALFALLTQFGDPLARRITVALLVKRGRRRAVFITPPILEAFLRIAAHQPFAGPIIADPVTIRAIPFAPAGTFGTDLLPMLLVGGNPVAMLVPMTRRSAPVAATPVGIAHRAAARPVMLAGLTMAT